MAAYRTPRTFVFARAECILRAHRGTMSRRRLTFTLMDRLLKLRRSHSFLRVDNRYSALSSSASHVFRKFRFFYKHSSDASTRGSMLVYLKRNYTRPRANKYVTDKKFFDRRHSLNTV